MPDRKATDRDSFDRYIYPSSIWGASMASKCFLLIHFSFKVGVFLCSIIGSPCTHHPTPEMFCSVSSKTVFSVSVMIKQRQFISQMPPVKIINRWEWQSQYVCYAGRLGGKPETPQRHRNCSQRRFRSSIFRLPLSLLTRQPIHRVSKTLKLQLSYLFS